MTGRRHIAAAVVGLLLLALVLRAGVIVATPGLQPENDARDYARHAASIAAGHGYPDTVVAAGGGPTALRPPAYPHFLAGVFAISGDSIETGRVAQALLGTAAVAMIGLVAGRLWGRVAGLVTIGLAAVYPPLVVSGAALGVEPLFLVLELAAVASALAWRRGGHVGWAIVTGVLAGLAILTRSNGAVLLLPLALAVWGRPWRSWRAALMPVVVVVSAAITVAPWTVRNALVFEDFIPVATQDGFTLAGTYNGTSRTDPRFPGAWRPANLDPAYARLIERHARSSEPELNAALRRAAREYAAEHPAYVAEVGRHNLLRLFGVGGRDFNRLATRSELGLGQRWSDFATYGFLPFAVLALIGCWTAAARRAPPWLWLVPVVMVASVMFLNASARFRIPVDPFVVMLAALAISAALTKSPRRPARSTRSAWPALRPPR